MNPKKSQFSLEEGKLLGPNIVSAVGVKIDPERVKEIQTLSVPRSKKDIQSFLGKINFVRRLIPNFAELAKHITSMLKKGFDIKWTDVARIYFETIKRAIMEVPTLISQNYSKEFHIFSFASGDTLETIFLQKDDEGSEHQVGYSFSIPQRNYDFGNQKLLDFLFNLREEERIYRSHLLLERNGVFLQWDLVLDDHFVISFKVTVFPGKDISKLLH